MPQLHSWRRTIQHNFSVATLLFAIVVLIAGCGAGPQGATGPAGQAGATGIGQTGATGATGADGQLRVYGNGSAGALTVSGVQTLFTTVAANGNTQFTSVIVDAGATLNVPSGSIIRCTGAFTNNGTITVLPPASVGTGAPIASFSGSLATSGQIGDFTAVRDGGSGGPGMISAFSVINVGTAGGGSGAPVVPGVFAAVSQGGGTLTILAAGAISNAATGTISADADLAGGSTSYGGGGAGGILILASPISVVNNGAISAIGSAGINAQSFGGPGGGGGGGIIHFLSPLVTAGTTTVTGGAGGTAGGAGTVTSATHAGGAGGGGCFGRGGLGGRVGTDGSTVSGTPGGAGSVVVTGGDPTALFF